MVAARRFAPALAAVLVLAACGRERPERVVLVTVDTLRYDALVGRDGAEPAMPHLLERARGGALFERFYAATSVTQPSHASMLTALQPWEHGVTRNGQVLEERFATVAEVLREAGFATGAVVASFPVAARFGFAQGFDVFSDDFTEHPVAQRRWEGHDVPGDRFYSLAGTVTDRALEIPSTGSGAARPAASSSGSTTSTPTTRTATPGRGPGTPRSESSTRSRTGGTRRRFCAASRRPTRRTCAPSTASSSASSPASTPTGTVSRPTW